VQGSLRDRTQGIDRCQASRPHAARAAAAAQQRGEPDGCVAAQRAGRTAWHGKTRRAYGPCRAATEFGKAQEAQAGELRSPSMGLQLYRKKRKFDVTPEPRGSAA